jgi:hypothetical protein
MSQCHDIYEVPAPSPRRPERKAGPAGAQCHDECFCDDRCQCADEHLAPAEPRPSSDHDRSRHLVGAVTA